MIDVMPALAAVLAAGVFTFITSLVFARLRSSEAEVKLEADRREEMYRAIRDGNVARPPSPGSSMPYRTNAKPERVDCDGCSNLRSRIESLERVTWELARQTKLVGVDWPSPTPAPSGGKRTCE